MIREETEKTRHEIMAALQNGPMCRGDLARAAGIDPARINYHLRPLEDQGYISLDGRARWNIRRELPKDYRCVVEMKLILKQLAVFPDGLIKELIKILKRPDWREELQK